MTSPRRPPGRYDEPRTHPQWLVWVVAGVLGLGVAAGTWTAYQRSTANRTDASMIGYHVIDDHSVLVRFEVDKARGKTVTCALIARDSKGHVVGVADVTVGPGTSDVSHTLTTSARADEAEVVGCSN